VFAAAGGSGAAGGGAATRAGGDVMTGVAGADWDGASVDGGAGAGAGAKGIVPPVGVASKSNSIIEDSAGARGAGAAGAATGVGGTGGGSALGRGGS
jgi:hypothetical protein